MRGFMKIYKVIRQKTKNGERGQAMLLIALAFIGLVAFIGLAIDAGILFAHIGHLRRGVDAAALSAANQIRQGYTTEQLETVVKTSAEELILLNLPADTPVDLNVVVETCDTPDTSIPNCTVNNAKRKLARVEATLDVNLAFLPMVGWTHVPITADAISEAASIDLVLVIDNSTSMAYDASCKDGDDDDGDGDPDDCAEEQYWWPPNQPGEPLPQNPEPCTGMGSPTDPCMDGGTEINLPDDYFRYPSICNYYGNCEPFEKVRTAAGTLIDSMFEGYDKIAIVTFNKFAGLVNDPNLRGTDQEVPLHQADLGLTLILQDARDALANMDVYPNMNIIADSPCPSWLPDPDAVPPDPGGDPRGCMRTNHAAGLMLAGMEFQSLRSREEAVKVVVLLSDGVANSAYYVNNNFDIPDFTDPVAGPESWICPEDWWARDGNSKRAVDDYSKPFCTDGNPSVGYNGVDDLSVDDPDDAARSFADWLGCLPGSEGGDCNAGDGLGAVIFTIGLGDGVINYGPNAPSGIVGEELLRYIARVGFNGEPEFTPNSPCWGVASANSCGNYYFSPNPDALGPIFEEIADRIFTRLTH